MLQQMLKADKMEQQIRLMQTLRHDQWSAKWRKPTKETIILKENFNRSKISSQKSLIGMLIPAWPATLVWDQDSSQPNLPRERENMAPKYHLTELQQVPHVLAFEEGKTGSCICKVMHLSHWSRIPKILKPQMPVRLATSTFLTITIYPPKANSSDQKL